MQYDPPDDPKVMTDSCKIDCCISIMFLVSCPTTSSLWCQCFQEYIHRVGRTARGAGAKGNALLILIEEEMKFLSYLKVVVLCDSMEYRITIL